MGVIMTKKIYIPLIISLITSNALFASNREELFMGQGPIQQARSAILSGRVIPTKNPENHLSKIKGMMSVNAQGPIGMIRNNVNNNRFWSSQLYHGIIPAQNPENHLSKIKGMMVRYNAQRPIGMIRSNVNHNHNRLWSSQLYEAPIKASLAYSLFIILNRYLL